MPEIYGDRSHSTATHTDDSLPVAFLNPPRFVLVIRDTALNLQQEEMWLHWNR